MSFKLVDVDAMEISVSVPDDEVILVIPGGSEVPPEIFHFSAEAAEALGDRLLGAVFNLDSARSGR